MVLTRIAISFPQQEVNYHFAKFDHHHTTEPGHPCSNFNLSGVSYAEYWATFGLDSAANL